MKLKIKKPAKSKNPTETFLIVINTMEGDADAYHKIEIKTKDELELRDIIIHASVMSKCYPYGDDNYVGPYYEKYFAGNLYRCDWGCEDSIEDFEVFYFDKDGKKCSVDVKMDEDMIEEIKHPKMTEEDLKKMHYS